MKKYIDLFVDIATGILAISCLVICLGLKAISRIVSGIVAVSCLVVCLGLEAISRSLFRTKRESGLAS